MSEVEQVGFSCASCGKQFRWKPELAGKKVACKCGVPLRVPTEPGGVAQAATSAHANANAPGLAAAGRSADVPARGPQRVAQVPPPPPPPAPKAKADEEVDFDDLYALAGEAEGSAPAEDTAYRCPYCQSDMVPGSLLCGSCGVDLQTGRRAAVPAAPIGKAGKGTKTAKAGAAPTLAYASPAGSPTPAGAVALPWGVRPRVNTDPGGPRGFTSDNLIYEGSKFRSLYLPLILIAVGLVFYVGQMVGAERGDGLAVGWAVFMLANFFVDAVLILAALLIAVKFLDMGFGALGPALLKIGAIAIGPGSVGEILIRLLAGPMGEFGAIIAGSVVAIVLYYTLIKVLFQLDLGETIRLTGLIYFLRRWVKFFLLMGLFAMFMSGGMSGGDDDYEDDGYASEESSVMEGAFDSAFAGGGGPPPKAEPKLPKEDERVVGHLAKEGYKAHGWEPRLASPAQHNTVYAEAEEKARAMTPEAKQAIIDEVEKERARQELIAMMTSEEMDKIHERLPDYSNWDTTRDGVVARLDKMTPDEQAAERKRLEARAKVKQAEFRKEYAAERAKQIAEEKAAANADGFDERSVGTENIAEELDMEEDEDAAPDEDGL